MSHVFPIGGEKAQTIKRVQCSLGLLLFCFFVYCRQNKQVRPNFPYTHTTATGRLLRVVFMYYNCNIYGVYTCRAALKCFERIFKRHEGMPLVFLLFRVYARSDLDIVVNGIYHIWGRGGEGKNDPCLRLYGYVKLRTSID